MGVFPAASSSHVPEPWAKLMHDPHSDIIDFYPEDFKIDLNGKKFAWQGVALLPFVDENRLFKALKPFYGLLTEQEIKRNKQGDSKLYIGCGNASYKTLSSYYSNKSFKNNSEIPISMDGMRGIILEAEENVPIKGTLHSPIMGLYDITDNNVITVSYRNPEYDENFIFPAVRLANAVDPPNILAPESRNSNYRPRIGFNNNLPQAYVTQGGHRMLNNSVGHRNQPQPQQQQQHRNHYQQIGFNYNNNKNRGGGGNHYNQGNRGNYGGNRGAFNSGNGTGYNSCYQRQHQNNNNQNNQQHGRQNQQHSSYQQNRYQPYSKNNRHSNYNNSRQY